MLALAQSGKNERAQFLFGASWCQGWGRGWGVDLEIRKGEPLYWEREELSIQEVGQYNMVGLNSVIGLVEVQLNLGAQGRENPRSSLGLSLARV